MYELIKISVIAAIEAGKKIITIYEGFESNLPIEKKQDNSPLTIADKKSHEIIESYLNKTPYPILSEEGRNIPFSERKKWDTFWLVDPLDGTKEFIKRNGEFTVNIALIKNNIPVAGVIYVPVTRELYIASEETGSRKIDNADEYNGNAQKILSESSSLPGVHKRNKFTVVASRSHMSPETETYINQQKSKFGDIDIISKGSSLKICLVAEGKADVYPRFAPTMEWDTAAGHAIARFAGKNVFLTDENTSLQYNKENLLNPWFIVK